MKKLYIITDLDMGGAEKALLRLMKGLDDNKGITIVSLVKEGVLRREFDALGIPIFDLGLSYGELSVTALWKLVKIIKKTQPNVIHSWMYHANVVAFVALKISLVKSKLIWAIRQCIYADQNEKLITTIVLNFSKHISKYVDAIVYNSELAMSQHMKIGVEGVENLYIPNGFEEATAGLAINKLRTELNISDRVPLIGLVGRYHPMKDYPTAVKALSMINKSFHAIFIGFNLDNNNKELVDLVKKSNLDKSITLLGERLDMPEIYSSLDYFLLSSSSEAFPNVLAEAMSYGCVCVSTTVGECSKVLSSCGFLSDPGDAVSMANNIQNALDLSNDDKRKLSDSSRFRIQSEYGIEKITKLYHQLYERTLCVE